MELKINDSWTLHMEKGAADWEDSAFRHELHFHPIEKKVVYSQMGVSGVALEAYHRRIVAVTIPSYTKRASILEQLQFWNTTDIVDAAWKGEVLEGSGYKGLWDDETLEEISFFTTSLVPVLPGDQALDYLLTGMSLKELYHHWLKNGPEGMLDYDFQYDVKGYEKALFESLQDMDEEDFVEDEPSNHILYLDMLNHGRSLMATLK